MYEGVRAPAVFTPKSLSEALETYQRYPRSVLWAGGTALMSTIRTYPNQDNHDILYLGEVKELTSISRTERYLEAGSMVTISRLLAVGQHILPPLLSKALHLAGPSLIQNQATIGGSLCHPTLRLMTAAALAVLEAQVEIRDSRVTKHKHTTRWVPVSRLYRRDGSLGLVPGEIVCRIRLFFEKSTFHTFEAIGSPYRRPDQAVMLSVFATNDSSTISEFRFAITLPTIDIIRSKEVETAITSKDLPLSSKEILQISSQLKEQLSLYSTKVTFLQLQRATRLFERTLGELNRQVLGG